MNDEMYIIDDRIIIPDFIDKMSDEELDAFIAEREAAAAMQKTAHASKPSHTMRTTA